MDSIIHWNINSYKTKFAQLKLILNKYAPICVCLQETRHTSPMLPPAGYNILSSIPDPTDGHNRGTAVLIHKRIKYEKIEINTNQQVLAVKLLLNKSYTVCNMYVPHIAVQKKRYITNNRPTKNTISNSR